MFFHLRCVALLGLLLLPYVTAQSFQNASSTHPTQPTSFSSALMPSPSRSLNSSSSNGYIQSCNRAWQTYNSKISRRYTTETVESIKTLSVSTSLLGIQTCSSTCGKICYASNLTITSSVLVPGTYYETEFSYPTRLTYTEPAPNCTIPASDCRPLWSSYTSADAAYSSTLGTLTSPLTPGCTVGCTRTTCRFGGGDKGAVPTPGIQERYWNSLKLFYFPETRNVSRDMCAESPTQKPIPPISATSYVPTTTEGFVVQDGKTLYKGNVYISIDQLEVGDNCGYTTVMHDVAFPVASTDVQSDRANEVNSGLWPVNWADFNEPVPWSAYAGGQGMTFPTLDSGEVGPSSAQYCKTAICGLNSVIPGEYNPWMILPQAIKHLDPEWADCDIPNDFTWFDPPIALHNAPAFLTTTPPDPVSTPAAPASSASALPVQTSDPAPSDPPSIDPPTNDPPTNDFPTNSDPPTNDPPTTDDPPSNNPATSGETPNNPASSRQAPADAASSPADPPALAGSTVRNHAPGSLGPSNTEGGFPSNSRPTGNGNAPGPSPIGAPAQASRPQITAGPTVIPIAPDGQGLVIHSPTTFAPSGSAVIGGTTFHLSYGVLTMVSAGGTSSITVGDASHNGIGTVIGLGTGGAFTITTAGGSLVFDVETTIENGDPAQTVGDVIVSVGSDGVQISDLKKGGKTSIAFTDVEGLGVSGAPFTEVASNGGSDAASTHKSGDSTIDTQSELAITSRLVLASSRSSLGGNGLADTAATASASKIGLDGSNRGSGTSVPPSTTSNTDEGAARSVPIPWYLGLLSMCILALHI